MKAVIVRRDAENLNHLPVAALDVTIIDDDCVLLCSKTPLALQLLEAVLSIAITGAGSGGNLWQTRLLVVKDNNARFLFARIVGFRIILISFYNLCRTVRGR
ncbi:MAG: hypothetical protein GPOALKHO_000578 [Sodalis sp.]|uniref:hypothetical protein n=1 Tax=Sodalis sp. (in: enterobacteria) TaxID=1898979 RepID=UPI003873691B|nr:MAG: hypothetical protein GPOALKHO_000578 [Sodalis sp.]